MIGIAKTGSGKTAAFIWPMLVHIMDQKELETGDGPIAVIVCPTRELCQQVRHIEEVAGLDSRNGERMWLSNLRLSECSPDPRRMQALREGLLTALRGSLRRRQHVGAGQSSAGGSRDRGVHSGKRRDKQPRSHSKIEPQIQASCLCVYQGRLIDHIKKKATSLQRVTYLVFDEADRMFDMGFGRLASPPLQHTHFKSIQRTAAYLCLPLRIPGQICRQPRPPRQTE